MSLGGRMHSTECPSNYQICPANNYDICCLGLTCCLE